MVDPSKREALGKASSRDEARKILEKARFEDPKGRLPSARFCAATWGISETTFRRAREELERQSGPTSTRPNCKSLQLVERIKQEIVAGRLRPGDRLEASEVAAAKWAASHPTLRKALRQLVREGFLLETPRGGEVPRPKLTQGTQLLLIQKCGPEGLVVGEAERMARFRREVELYAHKAGTTLEVWGFAGEGRYFRDGRPIASPRSKIASFHGVILSLWDVDDVSGLLEMVQKSTLPIAVWDERPQGGEFERSPLLRYFSSSYSSEAGAIMARHLADRGHQVIAYLSPLHGSVWSRMRLQGVREAASSHGMRVEACVVGDVVNHHAFESPQNRPEQYLRSKVLRTHLGKEIAWGVDDLEERLKILLRLRRMRELLAPLFLMARKSGATAWICANDDVAMLAWAWLSSQGETIPASVSLVGFDDTLAAQAAGLTSFYFNEADLAAACVRHLLAPKRLRSNEMAGRQTTIGGFVVARASVTRSNRG